MADEKRTVLIAGGSGFIGTRLARALLERNFLVVVVDIIKPKIMHPGLSFLNLDLERSVIPDSYDGMLYAIVNLTGASIFGRWTEAFKKRIFESRIRSTAQIVDAIARWSKKPKVFVCASAFGYYGDTGEASVDETMVPGDDFLSHVCADWEREAMRAEKSGVRVVAVRTALVLGRGGLLAPMFMPFKFGLGAWIGSGRAWFPWVHIDDIVGTYVFALENETLSGPVNSVSPEPVRQKEFMHAFGRVFHRSVLFSIPSFVMRMRYGALADTFESSTKLIPHKLISAGYAFRYPRLEEALDAVVREERNTDVNR